jgi:hypothetical protein
MMLDLSVKNIIKGLFTKIKFTIIKQLVVKCQ